MIEFDDNVRPSMALELTLQAEQRDQPPLTPANLFALAAAGPAWAVRHGGKLVALGGYFMRWPDSAVLWGYIGADAGPAMVAMSREVRRQLDRGGIVRYEAYAEVRHAAGRRWLELLGFRKESGAMRKFMRGQDCIMYARVRE